MLFRKFIRGVKGIFSRAKKTLVNFTAVVELFTGDGVSQSFVASVSMNTRAD